MQGNLSSKMYEKKAGTPLLSLASVAAVAVSVVGGGMTAAVVVVVAFDLHHAKK